MRPLLRHHLVPQLLKPKIRLRGGHEGALRFPRSQVAFVALRHALSKAWVHRMDTKKNPNLPLPKIDQLVDDAKTELKRAGIETEGKRSDEILKMAREERNKPRGA